MLDDYVDPALSTARARRAALPSSRNAVHRPIPDGCLDEAFGVAVGLGPVVACPFGRDSEHAGVAKEVGLEAESVMSR